MTNNKKQSKKKSKKQRRMLTMSLILSLVIIIGGTFAWFTSKDEVTNHLTADGKFGVEITETFTPPTNWGVDQTINKDVNLLNTGNTDALARVQLSSRATLEKVFADNTEITTGSTSSVKPDETNYIALTTEEAIAHQAGGLCVVKAGEALDTPEAVDSKILQEGNGLYIFQRTDDSDTTKSDLGKYAGYYIYDKKYYELADIANNNGTYTVKLAKKSSEIAKFTWVYDTADNKITLTYAGADSKTDDDVVITVNLNGGWSNSYQFIGDTNASDGYFYCTEVLKSGGKATYDLVDSVTLNQFPSDTYRKLEFDLDVVAEAVQAIYDDDGLSLEAALGEWAYNTDSKSTNYQPYGVGADSKATEKGGAYTITWSQQTSTTGN